MKPIHYIILGLALGGSIIPDAFADTSHSKMYTTCKAQAVVAYGSAEQAADVRLVNIKGHQGNKRLRLRITPPQGGAFTSYCEVDRLTGELVSLEPVRDIAEPVQVVANRNNP